VACAEPAILLGISSPKRKSATHESRASLRFGCSGFLLAITLVVVAVVIVVVIIPIATFAPTVFVFIPPTVMMLPPVLGGCFVQLMIRVADAVLALVCLRARRPDEKQEATRLIPHLLAAELWTRKSMDLGFAAGHQVSTVSRVGIHRRT